MILAFDVSNSMRAEDLEPTRMDAAKSAARNFVERQPDSVEIGVVAFSDGGLVTQPPTTTKADVLAAIDRLSPLGATSLGQGLFTAHQRHRRRSDRRRPCGAGDGRPREPRHRLLRLRRHRAAVRRREHLRPRPAGRRRAGVGGRCPRLPDRRREQPRGRWSTSTASASPPPSTRPCSPRSPRAPAGRTSGPSDAVVARRGLRQHRPAPHDRGRAHRGDGGRDRRQRRAAGARCRAVARVVRAAGVAMSFSTPLALLLLLLVPAAARCLPVAAATQAQARPCGTRASP